MTSRQLLWGLFALVAIGVLVLLFFSGDAPDPPHAIPPAEKGAADEGETLLHGSGTSEPKEDEPAPAPTEDQLLADWDPGEGVPTGNVNLKGIVVDGLGRPVPSASLWLRAKSGQPKAIDQTWVWSTESDEAGRWTLENTWAARSTLGVWAQGFEPAFVPELSEEGEIRIVLRACPTMTVTVHPPKLSRRELVDLELHPTVRVRLVGSDGDENPRPGQALLRQWEVQVALGKPTEIPVPRDQQAHLMAGMQGWTGWACKPSYLKYPSASKELEFQLVPSGILTLRLLDAKTGAELKLDGDGNGYSAARHVESGFDAAGGGGRFNGFVAVGEYEIELRLRGYVTPVIRPRVRVERPGQDVQLDIKLDRDLSTAALHVIVNHSKTSQRAGTSVEHGLLLARRRNPKDVRWRRIAFMSMPSGKHGMRYTAENLKPGIYDILAWDGSRMPPVGYVTGVELKGGDEKSVDVALHDGYGFRPGDALQGKAGGALKLRGETPKLGVLPWIGLGGDVYATDEQGFADPPLTGYIGEYPFPELTIVQRLKDATLKRHPVRPSISPPKR